MSYPDGNYYVEVKYHRYKIYPTENIILGLRDEPKSLRTQYPVQNEAQIRKNKKVIKNDNDQLVVKIYAKNKQQFNNNKNLFHQITLVVNNKLG